MTKDFSPTDGPVAGCLTTTRVSTNRFCSSDPCSAPGLDACEVLGELFQMASEFDPLGVQGNGPLGGFDRRDEGLLDEAIVTCSDRILLES